MPKPTVKIELWRLGNDPATVAIAEQIIGAFQREMPKVLDAVRRTQEWTPEGKRARKRLRAWVRRVRSLAKQTNDQGVVESVEKVVFLLRGELPDYFKVN